MGVYIYVGLVSPSRDANVAARSDGCGSILVGGVFFSSNIETFSNDPSFGRLHFIVAPGDVPRRSIDGDDREQAPGVQIWASTGGYHSSVKPPDE